MDRKYQTGRHDVSPERVSFLRPTVLAAHAHYGRDLTARQMGAVLGCGVSMAKRILQAFRETGEIPAYVQPRRSDADRRLTRQKADARYRETGKAAERNRRYRLRVSASAAPLADGRDDPREKTGDRLKVDIAAETAVIRAEWTAAQRAARLARPVESWVVPGVGCVRRWNGISY